MKLTDSITSLDGVGEQTAAAFGKLGVKTLKDLLFFLPLRIEDQSQILPISNLPIGENVVIRGQITNVYGRVTKRGSFMIEARIKDDSGTIGAVWFNQRFLLSQLKKTTEIMLFGAKKLAPAIGNPFVVKKIIKEAAFSPIYPATKGLHQGVISRLVKQVLPLSEEVKDLLPEKIRDNHHLAKRSIALKNVHSPISVAKLEQAKQLFGFEELLGLALSVELDKKDQLAQRGDKLIIDTDYLKKFASTLPFGLTNGQRRAAWQIITNMTNGYPARQILYGEVGSGKTVVSLLAALAVVRAGYQVLLLVPTTTLASQQAKNIKALVGQDVGISLITGSQKESESAEIVIGTHALLNRAENFQNVGLIIIDEQQRFGVKQRQQLLAHHGQAHLLMTTATPIPRSLAQTIFGNLVITYLLDKPAHQQRITTKRFTDQNRPSVVAEIRRRIAIGEPGYVICPSIDQLNSEYLFAEFEKKSVSQELNRLKKELPNARIEALHGRLPAEQKTKILHQFIGGQIDVLVSTTVVEVGIDNPKASWMIIENAEMFGLSTLHQLRGRIGRGEKSSVCFVSQTAFDEKAGKRLEMLEKSENGLALAEADLELRGPGEILGSEQSGLPSLRFASLGDKQLVSEVFALAQKIVNDGVEKYPTLKPLLIKIDGLATS